MSALAVHANFRVFFVSKIVDNGALYMILSNSMSQPVDLIVNKADIALI